MIRQKEKPKVLVTRIIPEKGLALLRQEAEVLLWPENDVPIPREELLRRAREVQGMISLLSDTIDGDFFDHAPHLKVVSNYAVGYDNIDVAEAQKRNIFVGNTPDVLTHATADLAFALILGISRRLGEAERMIRRGGWKSWGPTLLLGQDVYGATLGIVGLGRIGKAVAQRARGFSMNLLHTGPTPEDDKETGSRWVPLEELFRQADIISLHCPLKAETFHLVNEHTLQLMKPRGVLVNTGRGGLVDQEALYEALANRRIAGAGLDVFDPEPLPPDHPLLSLENLMALPHIGSASVSAREGMALRAAENVIAVLQGKTPPYRVLS